MKNSKGKIWIDLDNAPHIPFFSPIHRELEERGYEVWVTASARHQVSEMATMHGIPHLLVKGGYYGSNRVLKIAGILFRALGMLAYLVRHRPDLALSHGSRAQIVAAKMLGIPVALILDYEYARFPFAKLDSLITPEVIPESSSYNCQRLYTYHGLKEDVYAPYFRPDDSFLKNMGIDAGRVIATVRPPATDAHYHNAESEVLFEQVVRHISEKTDAIIVMLPRNTRQAAAIEEKWGNLVAAKKLIIPEKPIMGLDLIWESDLVVSGGGTMNREAAALGIPVYSIFRGKMGAVDRHLSESGRLTLIQSPADIDRLIKVEKRERPARQPAKGNRALHDLVNKVEEAYLASRATAHGAAGRDATGS